jgi:hypothetical protein
LEEEYDECVPYLSDIETPMLELTKGRYDKEAVHILLATPEPSPPSSSTASVAPAIQNLVSSVIPDALKSDEASSTSTGKGSTQNSDTSQHQQQSPTTQKPIGTVRYVPRLGKLTRLVVSKEYRQFGFGRVLVLKLEEEAVRLGKEGKGVMEDGKVKVKIHSQVSGVPLLGYRYWAIALQSDVCGARSVV